MNQPLLLNESPVIVLAAGRSSRMGTPKGLLPIEGETWLERQIRSMSVALLSRIIIVFGEHYDAYRTAIPALRGDKIRIHGLQVEVVKNGEPARGPFSSLQVGLDCAIRDGHVPAVFVLPIDVPCPSFEVWNALNVSLKKSVASQAATPRYQSRGGHPVLLSGDFCTSLLELEWTHPEARLDIQLQKLGDKRILTDVSDPRVIENINTPADWLRVRNLK